MHRRVKQLLWKERTMFLSLLLCFLVLSVYGYAQNTTKKVSLSCKEMPLSEALNQVERQSDYKLNFNYDELSQFKVTANIKKKNLIEAVNVLLNNLPFKTTVNGRFVNIIRVRTIVQKKQSQTKSAGGNITGQVLDTDGSPLIGVTVRVKGTNEGVLTDSNGNFAVSANDPSTTLLFTYIGKKDVELNARAGRKVRITLEDAVNALNDVVVTGYQTISKERATGSFDKIGKDVISSRPASDLSSVLQGLVAGMQSKENEDGSVNFLIRGTSSLYANTSPLVVVDGFPIEGTFNSINPNDVESVTVLKDAAAASIWGARSANGVLVVTTKKGEKGKLKVDVNAFYRIGVRPDLDYIMSQADSKTTVDYELMATKNEWSLSEFSPSSQMLGAPLPLSENYYYANKYYGMSEADMNTNLDRLRNTSNRDQLKKYLMQTQALQQYNVSISTGTEKSSTYASLLYEKNDEATIKRGYERYMANFNNSYKFNSWLTGNVTATFQRKNQETSGVTVSDFTSLSPYELLLNDDGSYATNVNTWNTMLAEKMNLQKLPYNDLSYNLLREVRNRNYKTETTRYRINLGLNAKIWRNLVFDTKIQYEKNTSDIRKYDNDQTSYVRDMIDNYIDFDLDKDVLTKQYIPSGGIIRSSKSSNENYVWRNQLSYNETFGKHDVSALAGFEMSQYKTSSTAYPYVLGYNEKTNTSLPAYYGSTTSAGTIFGYPDYYNTLASLLQTTYSNRKDKYFSYFANLAYMYDDKYGLSFSIRADGSNFVTKDKSLRWSPMWSIGTKWNMHKESFMAPTSSWLDRLTLRLTYGINGNAEKSTSPQTLLNTFSNATTGTNVSYISSYGNPLLRWEETFTTNLGVDFSIFKGLLSGKVEYYNRLGKYIVGNVTIPSVYGSTTQRYNNAEILNRGIEVELTGRGTIRPIGLGITSTVTFAYNKNKVKKLYYPSLYCYQLAGGTFVEGKPVGAIYSYEFAGTKDGTPYVKTADGQEWSFSDLTLHNRTLGLDKMTYSGTTVSPCTFGWANQLTWRGFDLYVFMTGNLGGVFRAPTATSVPLGNSKTFISSYIKDLMESDGTLFPTLPNKGDYMCYRWGRYLSYMQSKIENASFIRLKEINLAYHIPTQWLRKVHIQGAKVFVQARDLGMIYTANKYGCDPEWLPGTNKPAASFTFGANLNF